MNGKREFHGAKVALFVGDEILVYRRDNNPAIPFPNLLDLPGGGRENNETGVECVARETFEEFGLHIDPEEFEYVEHYPNWRNNGSNALFFVCFLTHDRLQDIVFGDEGQNWETMAVDEFLSRPDAVPHLQNRLSLLYNTKSGQFRNSS